MSDTPNMTEIPRITLRHEASVHLARLGFPHDMATEAREIIDEQLAEVESLASSIAEGSVVVVRRTELEQVADTLAHRYNGGFPMKRKLTARQRMLDDVHEILRCCNSALSALENHVEENAKQDIFQIARAANRIQFRRLRSEDSSNG